MPLKKQHNLTPNQKVLTRMNDQELRELDCLVHLLVFGREAEWDGVYFNDWVVKGSVQGRAGDTIIPYYSTHMGAAWKLVEQLTSHQYVSVHLEESHYHGSYCSISPADPSQREPSDPVRFKVWGVWGETMPIAVCRAVTKSIRGTL